MPMQVGSVDHIKDVSFQDYFLKGGKAVGGSIQVNHNIFEVSFGENGKVNARFTSGNWFTNLFRGKTLQRLTQRLETQYNEWLNGNKVLVAVGNDIKDNFANDALLPRNILNEPLQQNNNIIQNENVIEEKVNVPNNNIIIQNENAVQEKKVDVPKNNVIEEKKVDVPKNNVIEEKKVDAPPKGNAGAVSFADALAECREIIDTKKPAAAQKMLGRLDDIVKLDGLRKTLADVKTGAECDQIVRAAGFLVHAKEYCKNDADIKTSIINMLDTIVNGFCEAVEKMTNKDVQVIDFLRKLDGACLEAKVDNIQTWFDPDKSHSEPTDDLACSVMKEFNAIAKEVQKPFADELRKRIEPEVRAEFKNITDENVIKDKIEGRVQTELGKMDDEIKPLLREKLLGEGKFAIYEALGNAMRTERGRSRSSWTRTAIRS